MIDATVAQAASKSAKRGMGKQCREVLMDIFIICHRAVVSNDLQQEWNLHSSPFFTMWLSWMVKKRKLANVGDARRDEIRKVIMDLECDEDSRVAMLEDVHLVEAAIATDRRVVSSDSTARGLFEQFGELMRPVDAVLWLDPSQGDRPPGRR